MTTSNSNRKIPKIGDIVAIWPPESDEFFCGIIIKNDRKEFPFFEIYANNKFHREKFDDIFVDGQIPTSKQTYYCELRIL